MGKKTLASYHPILKKVTLVTLLYFTLDPYFWIANLIAAFRIDEIEQYSIYFSVRFCFIIFLIVALPKLTDSSTLKWQAINWRSWLLLVGVFALIDRAVLLLNLYAPPQQWEATRNGIQSVLYTNIMIVVMVDMIVLTPIFEELIFRAGILSWVFKDSKYGLDILISSSLFSLAHLLGHGWRWTDFTIYFFMGICFSIFYKTGKSVWYSILAHILWNFLAMLPYLEQMWMYYKLNYLM